MKKRFIKKQMDIAAQIYELMQHKGWTQKELAEKTGIYEQTLSSIMSGHANPTLKTLVMLEEALEADIVVAPKFYRKTLKKEGFTIIRQSIADNFWIDLDEWFTPEKEIVSNEDTTSLKVSGQKDSIYNIKTGELQDVKAA